MRRPFFVVAAGFVLGEVFALQMKMAGMETAEIETVGEAAFGAAILIFVCLAGLWRFRLNSGKEKGGRGKLLPFCVGVFALTAGVLWAEARIFTLDAQEQWVKERQEKGQGEFIGEIEQIEETGNGWELVIKNLREKESVPDSASETAVPDRLLVRAESLLPEDADAFFVGRTIRVKGEISAFDPARNPGEFDYRLYQFSRGIVGQISWARVEAAGNRDEMEPYPELLACLRNKWSSLIRSMCREPEAGLFCSVLLGDKKTLDTEIRSLYQQNGIAHLLAISGLHLSILGMGLYRLIRKAGSPILPGACAACAAVLSYGLLIGASGSTKRAIIMMLCAFGADCVGRTYDSLSALGLAALLIAGEEPYQLLQSGFQLSFGAVMGIGCFGSDLTAEWRRQDRKSVV